ncbi:hypothetical protein C8J56DRAFT_1049589 [Mycena floridula]|nr:hypothetical protein C8J56DRAFT_1049589 [Mycena floridula]
MPDGLNPAGYPGGELFLDRVDWVIKNGVTRDAPQIGMKRDPPPHMAQGAPKDIGILEIVLEEAELTAESEFEVFNATERDIMVLERTLADLKDQSRESSTQDIFLQTRRQKQREEAERKRENEGTGETLKPSKGKVAKSTEVPKTTAPLATKSKIPDPLAKILKKPTEPIHGMPHKDLLVPQDKAVKPKAGQNSERIYRTAESESQPVVGTAPAEPAYRNTTNIQGTVSDEEIYKKFLRETKIQLDLRDALAISPPLRKLLNDDVRNRRITVAKGQEAGAVPKEVYHVVYGPEDIVENYMMAYPDEPLPEELIVAKESASLRCITPLVGPNAESIECILDQGCQVVAISEAVWNYLGIPLDASCIIPMRLANGEIDHTLGIVRNLKFDFGGIHFFLQAHVVRQAAYDILLGRPFDCLSESILFNYSSEDTHIQLHDPQTKKKLLFPTSPRGKPRYVMDSIARNSVKRQNHSGFP